MITVQKIRMDYLDFPQGVEDMPQFGWVLASDRKNVAQRAYQLQIVRKAVPDALIYDSGRIESGESAHVRVEGIELEPCARYAVRARVWTDDEESAWSAPADFVTGMAGRGWQARFVTAESAADWGNSKGTYLRKSWKIDRPVREAVLCATALGLYIPFLNGRAVSGDRMLPGWTSYRKHLCYQTWDVSGLITPGENVLAAHVGAGWYKGMMGFIHERCNYGDRTALLMQLTIRYQDGGTDTIVTDGTWIGCNSPVTFSEIYDGERYDARLEQPGWNAPGFKPAMGGALPDAPFEPLRDRAVSRYSEEEKEALRERAQRYRPGDTLWRFARTVDFPLEVLAPQPGCRPAVMMELPVKAVLVTPKGETVLDFGQNLTGYVRFTVRGKRGGLCHLRCFETLDAEGNAYFENLRGALAEIRYTCRGEGPETCGECFSFQGFRYALIESWPEKPASENFTACVVHSDMRETGRFACSNPLINQLQHNIEWSLRGNFLDVPTDCPQRDERMGWTGDAQIFCRTAAYLRDVYPFFRKWLRDVAADQTEEGGVSHVVPDQLQIFETDDWLVGQGTHSASAWADVAVILPWTLYLTYGDPALLREQFDSMKKWVDFMTAHAPDGVFHYRRQFGDWVALDAEEGSYFGATPIALTCTAYYAYSASLFAKACRVLGKVEMAAEYEALAARVRDIFRREFLDDHGVMAVKTQTAHIVALYFHLVPPEGIPGTIEGLKRLLAEKGGHLVTGFIGTPYFCHALSQNGCKKEAYDLLLQEDFPSWLYQVKTGATTIWEHWDGLKPDGSMWSPDMNSFNHYAYGAIGEWLYRVVAGLEIDEEQPGYRHILFCPQTGGGLTFAQGSYESVYGTVALRWEREGETVLLNAAVPVNARASLILEEEAQSPAGDLPFVRNEQGRWQAEMGSGTWTFSYRFNAPTKIQ